MYKVILIDDENITLRLLSQIINWEEEGFKVEGTATDGVEGIEMYKKVKPDLIIVDIRMPIMDGIEFIKNIRLMDKRVDIIILSAYGEFEYAQKAISYGVSCYLLKPVDEDKLVESLKNIKNRLLTERKQIDSFDEQSEIYKFNSTIIKAKEYTKNNFMRNDFSIQDTSEYLGLSKNHFSKLFKEATGGGYWEYVSRLRIEHAKKLLKETNKTNFEISSLIGYESEYHFSRKFKEVVGITPTQFRKE